MANKVPTPDEAPKIPLVAAPANTVDDPVEKLAILDSLLKTTEPAVATFTAKASKKVVDACIQNNLGTHRPSEMMVGLDESNTYLYFIPVKPKTPGATEVKHTKGTMVVNLYPLFAKLGRLVPADIREYYELLPTPAEVTVGSVKGWGVYVNLNRVTKQPVAHLSEEEKAQRLAKFRQTLARKKAAKQAAQESAPGAEEPAPETEE